MNYNNSYESLRLKRIRKYKKQDKRFINSISNTACIVNIIMCSLFLGYAFHIGGGGIPCIIVLFILAYTIGKLFK